MNIITKNNNHFDLPPLLKVSLNEVDDISRLKEANIKLNIINNNNK